MTRRAALVRGGMSLAAAVSGAAAYARYVERLDVEVTLHRLVVGLDRPMKVVTIGDLHFDPFFEVGYVERVVASVNRQSPDVVVHTGDFVSHTASRLDELASALQRLSPRDGHLAILGNHDHWVDADRVTAALQRAGIAVLRNRSVPVPGSPRWFVTGLESFWSGRPDVSLLAGGQRDTRHIVIVHEPDAFDHLDQPQVALQLSGHTHGGQVRIPGYGAVSLPRWGKRYQMGGFQSGSRQLFVHRGLGTVDDHVRLNCRPEIAVLTIV